MGFMYRLMRLPIKNDLDEQNIPINIKNILYWRKSMNLKEVWKLFKFYLLTNRR